MDHDLSYRGSMAAPKYKHGDTLRYGEVTVVIQHRRYEGNRWRYGCLVPDLPVILWLDES